MSDPIEFVAATPRCGLPYLFPAQAQKELFVNRAFARTDLLLHAAIEGQADNPPAQPEEGACWIVGPDPTGVWHDQAGRIAGWNGNAWHFVEPRAGMRVFDRSRAVFAHHNNGWCWPDAVAGPEGGAQVDREARDAIMQLIAALSRAGLLGSV